jgi:hypothetical protein
MNSHFDRLSNAYAITLGDRLLPGAGAYGVGAIACVMPDESSAQAWVAAVAEDLATLGRGEAGVLRVGDPWKFMRRAAGEGLAGIEGAQPAAYPERFMFMVRVEEAASSLPTVLAAITDKGWDVCLTRTGAQALDHAEVLHWQRFDVLDAVTGQWGQTCPFRDWQQGESLYELRSESLVVLLAHVPLLGHWNSIEGAFAFFTSEVEALHYQQHHLGNGRNRMLRVAKGGPDDPHAAMASLKPWPVRDLRNRIEELSQIRPLAAWCINPDSHRENAAYGRLSFDGEFSVGMPDVTAASPKMEAVSGIWLVMSGNHFELERSMAPWTGKGTIRWSGGQSLQLLPLDRSFVLDSDLAAIVWSDEVSDVEAEELVAQHLDSVTLEESWEELDASMDADFDGLDLFHIECWDAVTGEAPECPWRFQGLLAAAKHLAAYEREHDRHHRIEGVSSCGHIGFSGSGDAQFESLRSSRFRIGLRRLVLRALRRGSYRPSDAADLVALCNGILSTLHVDYAGFAKDLLWATSPDQQTELADALDIPEEDWLEWQQTASARIDPRGERLATDRMGTAAWALLAPKTRHFVATALTHLSEQGHAPQLDYAPISLEVVKALEVELAQVFGGFRMKAEAQASEHDPTDSAEVSLKRFLAGQKAPTLGPMAHLLAKPRAGGSAFRLALYDYLQSLPNGAFLTSNAFVREGLQRVIHKYRNGGVHDSAISEAICRECVDVLIGSKASPGYVPEVAGWRRGSATSPDSKQ